MALQVEERVRSHVSSGQPESGVVRRIATDGLISYELADTELAHGTSLGNALGFATSKGTGAVENLFSVELGLRVTGSLVVHYFAGYTDLSHLAVEQEHPSGSGTLVLLQQNTPGTFLLHPSYQRHRFMLSNGVAVEETFFLPRTGDADPCLLHQAVRLENRSDHPVVLAVVGALVFAGDTGGDLRAEYDSRLGALVAWNAAHPEWVRVFGCPAGVDAHLATTDLERAWHPYRPLPDRIEGEGDLAGALQVVRFLEPGQTAELSFVVAFSCHGRDDAERIYREHRGTRDLLARTTAHYRERLSVAEVATPDPLINDGAQWSKANMLRVLARYPTGIAFTNEPGISSNVVARDVAWFVYGCDFVLPTACCRMLHILAQTQDPGGKVMEYYDARTLRTEDYGLNINDATPLFLMAAGHHLKTTGHVHCAEVLYPAMVRAAEALLSERDERGLVFCSARGTGEHGICGWRNVMPNVTINGAVTEVNSEAYAGLRAVAEAAEALGIDGDARRFNREAGLLRVAIEKHLRNPDNGLYYLNIDVDGRAHSEVTADLVFPLIGGVSDEETTRLISERLNHPDFMTEAGLRTLSHFDPLYTPDRLVGLQGGVWPGVTWWYAMSCLHADPGLMVEVLRRSYWQYIREPKRYNTVPGQFSEWFDGEALQNRGMRLSPWEPPRFLWALLEGALGVHPHYDRLAVEPTLPHDWKWCRVRNLPYRGQSLSWFLARYGDGLHLLTTDPVETPLIMERFDEDVSDLVIPEGGNISVAAFAGSGRILLCLGSTSAAKQPHLIALRALLENVRRYEVTLYSSEVDRWTRLGSYLGGALERLSIDVEGGGFAILLLEAR
ncbi:MAG TPA: hypothetical protein PLZ94_10800 [Armatimonadota bacterium]|mgnify:CR=1 FL=1|nr:hypothetical protein [Armatimonadota bacterium]